MTYLAKRIVVLVRMLVSIPIPPSSVEIFKHSPSARALTEEHCDANNCIMAGHNQTFSEYS